MSDSEKDQVIENHEYDGIQEFDNPLPRWWLATFFFTVIFAIGYYTYYEFMFGPTSDFELETALKKIEHQKFILSEEKKNNDPYKDIDLETLVSRPELVTKGKTIYESKCAACHLSDGGGHVGPNLTDNFWIHGKGTVEDIQKVVAEGGNPGKGMAAWSTLLPDEDILMVSVYVRTLLGTKPVKPKAAEGEEVK